MSTDAATDFRPDWTPTDDYRSRSRLLRLMREHDIQSVEDWHAWARADIGRYWDTTVRDLNLEFSAPYSNAVDMSGE